jgi:LacI family transcriptional regulator
MPAQQPTIHDVAAAAGVAISSVSRVLNGNTSNREMVERVRRAVREVGYVPSAAAQSLKTRHTGQIAFAMEDIGNAAYLAMVRAIQPALRDAGYRLLLHSTGADVADEIEVLESLSQRYVDGLILCPIRVKERHLTALRKVAVPVVVIGSLPEPVVVDNVRANSRLGARLAVEHLADEGCRRIGLINGPADTVPGSNRAVGYREGLETSDLRYDDVLVETAVDFHLDSGAEAMSRLLKRTHVDGLLGANDLVALGALTAIRAAGHHVPRDVRVVGIDDTDLARRFSPPLSSVDLGSAERGRAAADRLLARLKGDTSKPVTMTISPELVIRASSRVKTT